MRTSKVQISLRICAVWSAPLLFAACSSFYIRNFMPLGSLCSWAGRFESYLVGNPEDRFSRDKDSVCLRFLFRHIMSTQMTIATPPHLNMLFAPNHAIPLSSFSRYRNDLKFSDRYARANSADPDQTAPRGAVWSGSTLFAIPSASFGLISVW